MNIHDIIKNSSIDDQLLLMAALQDNLSQQLDNPELCTVSDWHKQLLEERLARFDSQKDDSLSFSALRAEIEADNS